MPSCILLLFEVDLIAVIKIDFQADLRICWVATVTKNRNEMADDVITRVTLTLGDSAAAFILSYKERKFSDVHIFGVDHKKVG